MSEPGAAPPTAIGTLRAMPGAGRLLLLGVFINNLTAFLNAFLVLFLVHRGFAAWQAGLALAALMLGRVLGTVFGGTVCASVGYRWTIAGSMGLSAALTVALAQAPDAPLATVIAGLTGVATRASQPAVMAWLAELTPGNQRVMVVALQRLAFNVGATLGPLIAALIIEYSYFLLFYADAATSLVFCGLAVIFLPEDRARGGRRAAAEQPRRTGYRQVLTDTRFVLVCAGVFFVAIVYIQASAALPLFVTGTGHSNRVYAVLLSVNALVVIALELLVSKWTQRLWAGLPMTVGMLMIGLGFLLYAAPGGDYALIVATVAWTLGEVVASPSMLAYPSLIAPADLRSRYIATTNSAQQLGSSVGPIVGVATWQLWGRGVWVVVGACGAVAAVLTVAGAGLRRPAPAESLVAETLSH